VLDDENRSLKLHRTIEPIHLRLTIGRDGVPSGCATYLSILVRGVCRERAYINRNVKYVFHFFFNFFCH
jgi:hypothetical protein